MLTIATVAKTIFTTAKMILADILPKTRLCDNQAGNYCNEWIFAVRRCKQPPAAVTNEEAAKLILEDPKTYPPGSVGEQWARKILPHFGETWEQRRDREKALASDQGKR